MPGQGEILLVPIPFTDLSAHKQRPVVVVSNDTYNRQMTDVMAKVKFTPESMPQSGEDLKN